MKQFKIRQFISASSRYTLIFLLAGKVFANTSFGQGYVSPRQLGATIYDDQLVSYDFDSIVRSAGDVVCIIGMSCSGCVEYFANKKIVKTFVYFIDNMSIMEMNRVRFQGTKPGIRCYFALRTNGAENMFTNRSPQLLHFDGSNVTLLDYTTLDRLTKGFTLTGKKARKQLEIR